VVFFRWMVPVPVMDKVRLATVGFAFFGLLPHVFLINPDLPGPWRLAGRVAVLALLVNVVVTYLRRRTLILDGPLVAVLVVVAGSSFRDPDGSIGVCLAMLASQSMYRAGREPVVRVVLVVAAFLIGMGLSPSAQARGLSWSSPQNLGLVPFIATIGVLYMGLRALLVRQQEAADRERVISLAGQDLIHCSDVVAADAIIERAAVALCAGWPGAAILALARRAGALGSELTVVLATGEVPPAVERVVGAVAAACAVHPSDGEPIPLGAVALGGARTWWLLATDNRYLLFGAVDRRLPAGAAEALRVLGTHWTLALMSCRKHAELTHHAENDALTSLPNRRQFLQRLAAECDARTVGLVLMLVDLDDFKEVNDSHGHGAGDDLLIEIAERLRSAIGTGGLAARLGGDEFAVLLTGVGQPAQAQRVAEEVRQRLGEPVRLVGVTSVVGASIGIAHLAPGLTAADLMRCADIAMYSAKAKGKNRVEYFTADSHESIAELRRMEEHLSHAIERGELSVHYQPLVDLDDGGCRGVEALARWHHPALGQIPPDVFIPMATRVGHIVTLGRFVLRAACQQLVAWRSLPEGGNLTMSVNVAIRQIYDPEFVETVRGVLADTGLPADRLILEITEEEPIDPRRASQVLSDLAADGVRIAIDDFGTGYAFIGALRSFPIHQIKIDRSLLAGQTVVDIAIFEAAAQTGVALGIEVVAEGVETEEQAETARRARVLTGQGYLYARPMPAMEFPAWLSRQGAALPVG
jgi:diguanylate cyclase (GGDEF)-like protein